MIDSLSEQDGTILHRQVYALSHKKNFTGKKNPHPINSVRMAENWPHSSSFAQYLWTLTLAGKKKKLANIQPSWPHTLSITLIISITYWFIFLRPGR